jgi:Fe-S cluster assembly protein SufD
MTRLPTDALQAIVQRLPTPRDEDWKYTDLSRAREISERWLGAGAAVPAAVLADDIERITSDIDANWFVIANGELTILTKSVGVAVEKVKKPPAMEGSLAELNAALLIDGLRIRVNAELEKPLGLLIIDHADEASVSQAFIHVEFASHSAGKIIEYHTSSGSADQYANTIVTIDVGDNASVRHVRIQDRARTHVRRADSQ